MSSRNKNAFDDPRGGYDARLLLAIAVWIGVHALTVWSARPTAPLPADAPERTFSAGRAVGQLEALAQDLGAHPSGSPAAHELRGRIVHAFQRLGYTPEVQEAYACGPYGTCGMMRNVVARLPGDSRGPATLLTAHYDSVGAGPGIADNLAGVAVLLEIARVLKEDARPERTVLFLITDGEEAGLVGATAFAREHPLMREVGVVLNVEARGQSGPSLMFETGADNEWLVDLFAAAAPHPAASSVSVEVYRRMPNDTDYTVFRERGVPGLNFAFIGDSYAYHTPKDDLEGLDPASVQHHGDNVLATLRALDEVEIPGEPAGDAVYADLFGVAVLRMSTGTGFVLALTALLGLVWGGHRAVRGGVTTWGRAGWGLAGFPLLVAFPVALGLGLVRLQELATGVERPWHANGTLLVVALGGASLFSFALLVPFLARRAQVVGLAHGTWIAWGFLGAFLALFVPGGSYLFFVPAVLLALVSLGVRLAGDVDARVGRAGLCIVAVAAALWAPVQITIVAALGPGASAAVVAPLACMGSLFAPLMAAASRRLQRALLGGGALVMVGAFALGLVLPRQTESRPAPLNLHYVDNDGRTSWVVQTFGAELPLSLRGLYEFGDENRGLYSAPAPPASIAAPVFEVREDRIRASGARLVRGIVRSPAHAGYTEVRVTGGGRLCVGGVYTQDPERADLLAVGPEGVEIEILFPPLPEPEPDPDPDPNPNPESESESESEAAPAVAEPLPLPPATVVLIDVLYGLPLEGADLLAARPAEFVPRQDGDVSHVRRSFALEPDLDSAGER